jgi:hypothetical protein
MGKKPGVASGGRIAPLYLKITKAQSRAFVIFSPLNN